MSLSVMHPLPARQLLRDVADREFLVLGSTSVYRGYNAVTGYIIPYMAQGYAWCVGHIRITDDAGALNLHVHQCVEDHTVVVAPPGINFGHVIYTSTFNVVAGTPFYWKVAVVSKALYLEFENEDRTDVNIWVDAFFRND